VGRAGKGDCRGSCGRGDDPRRLDSPKQAALDRLHDWLRSLPEHDLQRKVRRPLHPAWRRPGGDLSRSPHWGESKALADDPLVAIGGHSISLRTEQKLQRQMAHLAYPYGERLAAGMREFALARTAG